MFMNLDRLTKWTNGVALCLLATCVYVVFSRTYPVFSAILESVGLGFSSLSQWAFRLSAWAIPMLGLVLMVSAVLSWRNPFAQAKQWSHLVLGVGNLLMAGVIAMQSMLLLDLVIKLPAAMVKWRKSGVAHTASNPQGPGASLNR